MFFTFVKSYSLIGYCKQEAQRVLHRACACVPLATFIEVSARTKKIPTR